MKEAGETTTPTLLWDMGSAYDMFASLGVLHDPSEYALRAAWAAGMRARLPADSREILEQTQHLVHVPLHWIYTLPEPKDGTTVLWALRQIPPAERLLRLISIPGDPFSANETIERVAAQGTWDETDEETIRAAYLHAGWNCMQNARVVANNLKWIARAEEFGTRYLEALRAYQEAFYAEEEKRIRPALVDALDRAQALAQRLALPDLLEELSQGLRISELPQAAELVLAPSYWTTPLVTFGRAGANREIWLFGARPADAALVPGEAIPDAVLRALKALADPTRLRILRYLSSEQLTPAELARRLRLRAPTVTHHLKALRLAGLVQIRLALDSEKERYAARPDAVANTFALLKAFFEGEEGNE